MQFEWRKLRDGEEDIEFVFGVCVLSVLLILVAISTFVPERYIPPCFFLCLTSIPCFTCGSYRALMMAKTGRLWIAFGTQPLMVLTGFLTLIYAMYSWVVVLGRKPRLRIQGRVGLLPLFFIILLVLANWLYIIHRHL